MAPSSALAIRPFVTDDARVVGEKLMQLETWLVLDRLVLEHNALVALGPTHWLELTAGLIHGGVHKKPRRAYSITGPILQAKMLVKHADNNSWPGIAVSFGALAPFGRGPFEPPGWTGFAYAAATESLWEERLLIHANLGLTLGDDGDAANRGTLDGDRVRSVVTAGLGMQGKLVAGLHGMAEVYYGDPYDPRFAHPAAQLGFRYIFSDRVQMDGTFGSTLQRSVTPDGHAQTEQWGTLGLRLVSPELW